MTEEEIKFNLLNDWTRAVQDAIAAKLLIEREATLRREVMLQFFPAATKGVNKTELNQGWILKGTHKLTYNIDPAALSAASEAVRGLNQNPDVLVKWKPDLNVSAFSELEKLCPEAALAFHACMTIKPAMPTLELIAPRSPA